MRPKAPADDATTDFDMFRHRLDNMIDLRHPLARLAGLIDWRRFDETFGPLYSDKAGRPGLPTRLMIGLHLVKHVKRLSDEEVCAQFVENPYVQFFCGETHFQTRLPIDRSSMTRWRQRIGPERLEALLAETLAAAERAKALKKVALERVTVDTTVQTKAIAHPTDSRLLKRGIEWLNRLARKHGVKLRQSYMRVAAHAAREVARLIHGRGHKQAMRWLRKLRTWTGRLLRDIRRKIAGDAVLEQAFAVALARVEKMLGQKPGDSNRLYALHAPEVECIGKGKPIRSLTLKGGVAGEFPARRGRPRLQARPQGKAFPSRSSGLQPTVPISGARASNQPTWMIPIVESPRICLVCVRSHNTTYRDWGTYLF